MANEEILQLIKEKARAAEENDYFELLGIAPDASKPEVQKAYFDLAKQLHPDRIAKYDLSDVGVEPARIFKTLSDAYNTLMDPKRKQKYLQSNPPKGAGAGDSEADVRSTQELLRSKPSDPGISEKEAAKIFYHKGMMAMRKGGFSDAEDFLTKAVTQDDENARYSLQLGWAIFQNPDRPEVERLRESRPHLEKAVGKDPKNPEAHYYMARHFKLAGDKVSCRKHLVMALKFRNKYIEARRELRLLDMRAGKKPAPSGKNKGRAAPADADREGRWPFGLDRLFKKKK